MSKYRFLATREFEFIIEADDLDIAEDAAKDIAFSEFDGWVLDRYEWNVMHLGHASSDEKPDLTIEE